MSVNVCGSQCFCVFVCTVTCPFVEWRNDGMWKGTHYWARTLTGPAVWRFPNAVATHRWLMTSVLWRPRGRSPFSRERLSGSYAPRGTSKRKRQQRINLSFSAMPNPYLPIVTGEGCSFTRYRAFWKFLYRFSLFFLMDAFCPVSVTVVGLFSLATYPPDAPC